MNTILKVLACILIAVQIQAESSQQQYPPIKSYLVFTPPIPPEYSVTRQVIYTNSTRFNTNRPKNYFIPKTLAIVKTQQPQRINVESAPEMEQHVIEVKQATLKVIPILEYSAISSVYPNSQQQKQDKQQNIKELPINTQQTPPTQSRETKQEITISQSNTNQDTPLQAKSGLQGKTLNNQARKIEWKIKNVKPLSGFIVEDGVQIYLTNNQQVSSNKPKDKSTINIQSRPAVNTPSNSQPNNIQKEPSNSQPNNIQKEPSNSQANKIQKEQFIITKDQYLITPNNNNRQESKAVLPINKRPSTQSTNNHLNTQIPKSQARPDQPFHPSYIPYTNINNNNVIPYTNINNNNVNNNLIYFLAFSFCILLILLSVWWIRNNCRGNNKPRVVQSMQQRLDRFRYSQSIQEEEEDQDGRGYGGRAQDDDQVEQDYRRGRDEQIMGFNQ